MQNEAIEVGKYNRTNNRLGEILTSRSTAGHGAIHHREGGFDMSIADWRCGDHRV